MVIISSHPRISTVSTACVFASEPAIGQLSDPLYGGGGGGELYAFVPAGTRIKGVTQDRICLARPYTLPLYNPSPFSPTTFNKNKYLEITATTGIIYEEYVL